MQLFEFFTIISSTVYLIYKLFYKRKTIQLYAKLLLVILLMMHLCLEGYRWQMIPAYFIWLLAILPMLKNKARKWVRIISTFAIAGLFTICYLLCTNLPVFNLPKPTGEYQVATSDIYLTFYRDEIITQEKGDQRKLVIKTWYPTAASEGIKDTYVDQGGRHGFALKYGLPKSTFNYLDKVDTHIFKNATPVNKQFPVLIFSHGYHSKANSYYSILSELASHGYIVFALNHTYESTGSTFADGSEVYFDTQYANNIQKDSWQIVEPLLDAIKNNTSFEHQYGLAKKALTTYFVKDMVERWALDISDMISALDSINENGRFKNKLDLHRIGVLGHSRGGGAAGQALLSDPRIKSGVNIDGVQWGEIVNTQFQKPFLYISADWPESHENLNVYSYYNKSSSVFYEAKILQTAHCNFMDIPFMIPNPSLSEAGSIEPELGIEITNRLLHSFFDTHLKDKSATMLELENSYEELELKIYNY